MRFAMENIAFDPSEYIMDHAILVASICMGESISTMRGPRMFCQGGPTFFQKLSFLMRGERMQVPLKRRPSSARQRNAI